MRLLVTGGAGFIGSHYVRTRARPAPGADRARRRSWCSTSSPTPATSRTSRRCVDDARLRFVEGDIRDRALRRHADGARSTRSCTSPPRPTSTARSCGAADFVLTNVVGTQTLLDAALQHGIEQVRARLHRRGLRLDRRGQLGRGRSRSSPTRRTPRRRRPATCSPAPTSAPTACRCAITRCSNNYGPYQFPEKVIPLFVTNLIDGKHVPLYGEGTNIRDWLHVDDHSRGIDLVLAGGRPGEVYNIGGGTELTNKELTGLLLEATGTDWDRRRAASTDRLGHDLRYSVDITKISDELGYEPQVAFEQGLADTVDVVPRQPRLVGAAQGPGARPRLTSAGDRRAPATSPQRLLVKAGPRRRWPEGPVADLGQGGRRLVLGGEQRRERASRPARTSASRCRSRGRAGGRRARDRGRTAPSRGRSRPCRPRAP